MRFRQCAPLFDSSFVFSLGRHPKDKYSRREAHLVRTSVSVLSAASSSNIQQSKSSKLSFSQRTSNPLSFAMAISTSNNAIYFPEGVGYLLVKVLQTIADDNSIESNVMLVQSLENNKLYIRKTVGVTESSISSIPNEIEFHPSFSLVPHVQGVTKYLDSPFGEYYYGICTEFCNGGDLRGLFKWYRSEPGSTIPEVLVWKFMADLIKILSFLSEKNIEHKDIWPQNIFLRYSEENQDNSLPDFVLGDFGWAVPLIYSNRGNDLDLFCARLLEMCCDLFDKDKDDDLYTASASHLSVKLRETVNHIVDLSEKFDLSIDYLVKDILPLAEDKIRHYRDQVPNERHRSSLPLIPKIEHGDRWPEKLEYIREDWQLVQIQEFSDGSGKLTILGLPRSTIFNNRQYFSFIRCTNLPFDLDLIYRFNAGKTRAPPPIDLTPRGTFENPQTRLAYKAMIQRQTDWQLAQPVGLDNYPEKKRRLEQQTNRESCYRQKKKQKIQPSYRFNPATVDVGFPLLSQAVPRMAGIADVDSAETDKGHSLLDDLDETLAQREAAAEDKVIVQRKAKIQINQIKSNAGRSRVNGLEMISLMLFAASFVTFGLSLLLKSTSV